MALAASFFSDPPAPVNQTHACQSPRRWFTICVDATRQIAFNCALVFKYFSIARAALGILSRGIDYLFRDRKKCVNTSVMVGVTGKQPKLKACKQHGLQTRVACSLTTLSVPKHTCAIAEQGEPGDYSVTE